MLRTKLRDANLADADLSTAKGLLAEQLAGANLSGAKLPDAVGKFDKLNHVAERSQLAKRLFAALLLGCIYALLTVATTTDVRLLTNSASSPLPVIQTEVPIAGFYFAAPVILVGIYLYFLLYLQRLWESLAKLPAVFPDGTPLDEKAYPWLMNGLVRSHFKLLRERPPPLSGLQAVLALDDSCDPTGGRVCLRSLVVSARKEDPASGKAQDVSVAKSLQGPARLRCTCSRAALVGRMGRCFVWGD